MFLGLLDVQGLTRNSRVLYYTNYIPALGKMSKVPSTIHPLEVIIVSDNNELLCGLESMCHLILGYKHNGLRLRLSGSIFSNLGNPNK